MAEQTGFPRKMPSLAVPKVLISGLGAMADVTDLCLTGALTMKKPRRSAVFDLAPTGFESVSGRDTRYQRVSERPVPSAFSALAVSSSAVEIAPMLAPMAT